MPPVDVVNLPGAIDATLASVLAGGQTGLLSPISFCHWQPDETTNTGRYFWSIIFSTAQTALAIYNAIKQEEISDKQLDLAESWYDHSNYKWNRFNNNYRPLEQQLLNEVSNKPVPKLNCKNAKFRAEQSVNTSYTVMDKYFKQQTKKYNLCINNSQITSLNVSKAAMLIDAENYNLDDDRWYRDIKDDQRWGRRSNVLNLGRNLGSTALTYGKIASNIFGAVGHQYDRMAQSAVNALGYFGARNDTYMPHTSLGSVKSNIETVVGAISPTMLSPTVGGLNEP